LSVNSVRKSVISALFGWLIGDGLVRLETTLSELDIVDSPQLTPMEKSATLEHLLISSSGVYLPLRYETSFDVFTNTAADWPARDGSVPGARFHYSNWDFNVLGEIYQRVSGIALFVAVDRLLAQPLGFATGIRLHTVASATAATRWAQPRGIPITPWRCPRETSPHSGSCTSMAANGKASRSFRSNGFGDAPGRWWPRACQTRSDTMGISGGSTVRTTARRARRAASPRWDSAVKHFPSSHPTA
jgi:CubicO group peptidase (beta-lactamase class C family)